MIVESSSGLISTSGGAAYGSGSGRSAYRSAPGGSASSLRKTTRRAPAPRARPASFGSCSPSTSSTAGSQSSRACANSLSVHQVLSGTATRPASWAAQNAICHSGLLRIATTARSPGRSPYTSVSRRASEEAAAKNSPYEQVRSPEIRNGCSPKAQVVSTNSRRVRGPWA